MILLDTNILSTFGKIDRFDLLLSIFNNEEICVSSNVFNEVEKANEKGYDYAKRVLALVHNGKVKVVYASENENDYINELPRNFGLGEKDSLAIAFGRNAIFVTNERLIINYCLRNKIDCLSLNELLRILWRENILSKEKVKELIDEIETKDKIIIMNKDEIFKD